MIEKRWPEIYAVDFDGTLCENKWPEIGEANQDVIDWLKLKQKRDRTKLILWTCRTGRELEEAVTWCEKQGLVFDAVNENLPELVTLFNNDCRKIFANRYVDDRALEVNTYTKRNAREDE